MNLKRIKTIIPLITIVFMQACGGVDQGRQYPSGMNTSNGGNNESNSSYTVTYSAGENGNIAGITSQNVNHGESGSQVIAVPSDDYYLLSWSDGSKINPRIDESVTENIDLIAFFALKEAQIIILTTQNPNSTVHSGKDATIYGTNDSNAVTIEGGASVKFMNFSGENTITIQLSSELFNVSRSGSVVTIKGAEGTEIKVPATGDAQSISFTNKSLILVISNSNIMLGNQMVTLASAPVE